MTWWHALALGVLQGLTEFLPVSSSGHLALAQILIPGFSQPGVVFDAMLHVGTAMAVVWFERRQLRRWLSSLSSLRLAALLVVATLATALLAFPLRRLATAAFEHSAWIGVGLLVTGAVLIVARFLSGGGAGEAETRFGQAVAMGLVQGLAVFPGVSRSGSTIVAGLGCGLERAWAARFSFLLSVPAILGATMVEVLDHRAELSASGGAFWLACALGTGAAAVAGYLALKMVLATVTSRVFHRFAWYCLPLGLVVLLLSWGGVL
jgi:undecaprenyl-diphosphatase